MELHEDLKAGLSEFGWDGSEDTLWEPLEYFRRRAQYFYEEITMADFATPRDRFRLAHYQRMSAMLEEYMAARDRNEPLATE
jgi:hypothetical protein